MIKRYKTLFLIDVETINGVVPVVLNEYQLSKLSKELVGAVDDGK